MTACLLNSKTNADLLRRICWADLSWLCWDYAGIYPEVRKQQTTSTGSQCYV